MKVKRVRNDMVLIQVVDTGRLGAVLTPQKSAEGKEYHVELIGRKVEDLEVGEKVILIGNSQSLIMVPGDNTRFITAESNLLGVLEKEIH